MRFLADVALTGHALLAAAWWWLMPGGFAPGQLQFWVNAVLPWAVVAAVTAARFFPPLRGPVFGALAALWLAAAVAARVVFPVSFRLLWLGPLLGAALLALVARADFRRSVGAWLALALGAALGGTLPFTQRASAPATRPTGGSMPAEMPATSHPADEVFRLSEAVRVFTPDGSLRVQTAGRALSLRPLLTFDSRSPDGCWTIFARAAHRNGPRRQLLAAQQRGPQAQLAYRDDGRSTLTVEARDDRTRIEASSDLPAPVWSHLNTFAELQVSAHGALAVAFSPCPAERIEIHPMDYPFGRPARFAFVDAAGVFRVVEARSAEKGPFRTLAAGTLAADTPLTLTFYDAGGTIFRVTLEDWAAQASRAPSPTAGWGVPQNAIEFSLASEGLAHVFITLAATSVGRGFDSVGHAAGTYRTRITIETLGE